MSRYRALRAIAAAAALAVSLASWARAEEAADVMLATATDVAAPQAPAEAPAPAADAAAPEKGPPLPFHTIEGVGGGGITPMAYLINPGSDCCPFGKPSAAITDINAGAKNLTALTVTETLFGRIELGYGADRLGLGTLPDDIRNTTGVDIAHSDVWLHNFNVRALLVKENDTPLGDIAMPAITAGIDFKVNDGIGSINQNLNNALHADVLGSIGYRHSNGTDFTLTASKTIPKTLFDRPLIVTGGLRLSEAADLGFLGFGDTYHATFEGSVCFLPFDKLLIGYEFRQNTNPFTGNIVVNGITLIGGEDNWQAIDAALIVNKNTDLIVGYGHLGNLANAEANGTWFFQFKYEF